MKTLKFFIVLFLSLIIYSPVQAERNYKDLVTIRITPNNYDWNYKMGEDVTFTVSLIKDNQLLKDETIYYECGPEQQKASIKDSLLVKNGEVKIKCKGLKAPGFLTCNVKVKHENYTYSNLISVAYEPENIQPTTTLPSDFTEFWDNQKNKLASIPLSYKTEYVPSESTEDVEVYRVRINFFPKGNYIYGILCKPKKAGKYPAVLRLPGAGVTKHKGDKDLAKLGVITFQIGIHGIPLDMPDEIYTSLWKGSMSNYMFSGLDDKETYYYNRVYLACIRANDFIASLPEFDGENLAAYGGSQGGALSIVTSCFDTRVKYMVALYPALSDITGYLHGRAGGWPHFNSMKNPYKLTPQQADNSRYYDVVNFARFIKIPGFYSWGYCDTTCPPTSFYSAYNQISADKEIYLIKETGHWRFPEQNKNINKWLVKKLTSTNK